MDKRDFSAADVLTAVQTINHHVKDLQKLAKYIDFCLVSERCSNEQVQLMRREALDTVLGCAWPVSAHGERQGLPLTVPEGSSVERNPKRLQGTTACVSSRQGRYTTVT